MTTPSRKSPVKVARVVAVMVMGVVLGAPATQNTAEPETRSSTSPAPMLLTRSRLSVEREVGIVRIAVCSAVISVMWSRRLTSAALVVLLL